MHRDVTVERLIAGLPIEQVSGDRETRVSDISEDSRGIVPGSLFVARSGGAFDGRRFIADAVTAGAVAVLQQRQGAVDVGGAASLVCDEPCGVLAALAERFFGEPAQRLQLVGVTGTNGKTTVATLVRQLLDAAGRRCGLMGTVETHDGCASRPANLTTMPPIDLSRTLGRMVDNGCDTAAMEVSSHALEQGRVAALRFATAVFTNLSGDHLDYHGTMERYAAAKALLFESLPQEAFAIINNDDANALRMVRDCGGAVLRSGFDASCDFYARIRLLEARMTRATFHTPDGAIDVHLPLTGAHNASNALQAAAAAWTLGVPLATLEAGLSRCTAPAGRLERVEGGEGDPTVLVDYAHTDDALANVLRAVRPTVPAGASLRVLFGCGGDRDRSKRPRMARVACELADAVMITSDNPRTEEPASIINDIVQGVPTSRAHVVETQVDRRGAIFEVVAAAGPGDVIVIAGKGHEDYQVIGTTRMPFDDRLVAREALTAARMQQEVAA